MNMKTIFNYVSLLVLLNISALPIPVHAQKQAPPEGSAPKPFAVPASETYALPNGLKVTLVPYGIIPKAAINVVVDAGQVNEAKEHAGVASLAADLQGRHRNPELRSIGRTNCADGKLTFCKLRCGSERIFHGRLAGIRTGRSAIVG